MGVESQQQQILYPVPAPEQLELQDEILLQVCQER